MAWISYAMCDIDVSTLNTVVANIRGGGEIISAELVALLYVDSKAGRCRINEELTRAYLESGRLEEAANFANRAWQLSDDNLGFLPAYLEIHTARGDLERVRDAYKQVGMRFAAAGNVPEALRYFNLHHYVYQSAGQGDRYDYDFDILNAIERLAKLRRIEHSPPPATELDGKTRIAYLVFGAAHDESVLIKLLCSFAQHHDPTRYLVRFFLPENPETANQYVIPNLRTNLQKLETAGASIEIPEAQNELGNLISIADKMADFRPGLLVTTAALADYAHYYLASTRPAPVRIGLVYGPPEQYVAPDFDWVVSGTKHPLMDSPCDGIVIPIEVDLPDRAATAAYPRSQFQIPEDAAVIVIVGRPEKLINREYWRCISTILSSNQRAFMLIVGASDIPEACAADIAPAALPRLQLVGYRNDYLQILAMADIVLDTFPSGGGVTLLDAMALGIPVATFCNDYSRKFDQTNWSPAEELFDVTALIAPRGDFECFAAIVRTLIEDPGHRQRMGEKCRESVLRLNGQPERMVRRHEAIYEHVLENYRLRRASA